MLVDGGGQPSIDLDSTYTEKHLSEISHGAVIRRYIVISTALSLCSARNEFTRKVIRKNTFYNDPVELINVYIKVNYTEIKSRDITQSTTCHMNFDD